MSSYKIPFSDAVRYIEGFINKFPEVARNEALGGTILKDRIDGTAKENSRQYRGNMAWYCYHPMAEPPNPKLFISFEESNEYEEAVMVDKPDLNELRCPSFDSIFNYQGGDVRSMLETHQPQIGDPVDLSVSKSSVVTYKNNFIAHPKLVGQNQYPYGFFENKDNPDVNDLIVYPGVVYIRYYFGYIETKPVNKIRLVLIGVDESGRNIVPDTKEHVEQNEPIILQTSWPPKN